MADLAIVSSLMDKLRTMVLGGSPCDANARRALEFASRFGRRIELQPVLSGGRSDQAIAASIEQVRQNDFIINRPMIGAVVRPLAVNEPLHINFIGPDGRCTGRTKVLSRYRIESGAAQQGRVLYGYRLAIPQELHVENRRRFHRVSLEYAKPVAASLVLAGTSERVEGTIIDVSAGGMRLRLSDSNVKLLDGQSAILSAVLPEPAEPIAETVRIVRVEQCTRSQKPIVAVAFEEEVPTVSRFVRQLDIRRASRTGRVGAA